MMAGIVDKLEPVALGRVSEPRLIVADPILGLRRLRLAQRIIDRRWLTGLLTARVAH